MIVKEGRPYVKEMCSDQEIKELTKLKSLGLLECRHCIREWSISRVDTGLSGDNLYRLKSGATLPERKQWEPEKLQQKLDYIKTQMGEVLHVGVIENKVCTTSCDCSWYISSLFNNVCDITMYEKDGTLIENWME